MQFSMGDVGAARCDCQIPCSIWTKLLTFVWIQPCNNSLLLVKSVVNLKKCVKVTNYILCQQIWVHMVYKSWFLRHINPKGIVFPQLQVNWTKQSITISRFILQPSTYKQSWISELRYFVTINKIYCLIDTWLTCD